MSIYHALFINFIFDRNMLQMPLGFMKCEQIHIHYKCMYIKAYIYVYTHKMYFYILYIVLLAGLILMLTVDTICVLYIYENQSSCLNNSFCEEAKCTSRCAILHRC